MQLTVAISNWLSGQIPKQLHSKKIEWPRKKNGLIIAEQIKRTRASGAASPFLLLLLALESFYHNACVLVRVPVFCVCVSEPIKCFFVSRCVCEGAKFQKQPPKSFFRCQTVYFARHSKWDASFESVNAVSSFTFNGGPCGVYLIQAATREERLNPCQPLI